MKKKFFILIILTGIAQFSTIEQIVLIGNNVTSEHTILRYINHSIGDTINIDQAIEDQLSLYETGLFYDVIIQPADSIYYIYLFEKPDLLKLYYFLRYHQLKIYLEKHILLNFSSLKNL